MVLATCLFCVFIIIVVITCMRRTKNESKFNTNSLIDNTRALSCSNVPCHCVLYTAYESYYDTNLNPVYSSDGTSESNAYTVHPQTDDIGK